MNPASLRPCITEKIPRRHAYKKLIHWICPNWHRIERCAARGGTCGAGYFVWRRATRWCAGCWKVIFGSDLGIAAGKPDDDGVSTASWRSVWRTVIPGLCRHQKIRTGGADRIRDVSGRAWRLAKIPTVVTLETAILGWPVAQPRLFAAVDGLTSAENIGLLVRNCAAFGAQALIVGETSSSQFFAAGGAWNSMGTIFQLPIVELKSGDEQKNSRDNLVTDGIV